MGLTLGERHIYRVFAGNKPPMSFLTKKVLFRRSRASVPSIFNTGDKISHSIMYLSSFINLILTQFGHFDGVCKP